LLHQAHAIHLAQRFLTLARSHAQDVDHSKGSHDVVSDDALKRMAEWAQDIPAGSIQSALPP
jgi:hypothetical protein